MGRRRRETRRTATTDPRVPRTAVTHPVFSQRKPNPNPPRRVRRSMARRALALCILLLFAPGCVQLQEADGTASPLVIYIENDSQPEARFVVTVNDVGPLTRELPANDRTPNVEKMFEGTVHGETLEITVRETVTGTSKEFNATSGEKNFLIIE